MNSHTTNAYPITKEVYNYLLPVYDGGDWWRRPESIGFSATNGIIKT